MQKSSLLALLILSVDVYGGSITIGILNGGNTFPFGGAAIGFAGTRYQQAYAGSAFTGLGTINITGISFFVFQSPGNLAGSTYNLFLSTITAGIDTLSNSNFNSNLGPNNSLFTSVALSGPPPSTLTFSGGPFVYNPAAGNLLLDIIVSPGGVPFSGAAFQAMNGGANGIFSRYHNFGIENIGWGLVTRFDYDAGGAIPEPASVFMAMGGLALLGTLHYRHRRRSRGE